MASLSDADIQRCLYHLGYLGVSQGFSIQLGIPAASQPMFITVASLQKLIVTQPDFVAPKIISILGIMDAIEAQEVDALRRFKARKVGEIELNEDETAMLRVEYRKWGKRLGDILGTPPNPYSPLYQEGSQGINAPLRNTAFM